MSNNGNQQSLSFASSYASDSEKEYEPLVPDSVSELGRGHSDNTRASGMYIGNSIHDL